VRKVKNAAKIWLCVAFLVVAVKVGATSPTEDSLCSVALRTNLLLDIMGGVNAGLEVPIGERFSVAGDISFAYVRIKNLYTLQTLQASIEGRYWFSPRQNRLTGWNVGVYGTYNNRFDIQWRRGHQGDGFWAVGASGGYSWRLSRRLNLDVSARVGAGWFPQVRSYNPPEQGHLMWTETRHNATVFMPPMLKVNLTWFFGAPKQVLR
jgi:hypothetical protein